MALVTVDVYETDGERLSARARWFAPYQLESSSLPKKLQV